MFVWVVLFFLKLANCHETFSEELVIKPLESGHLMSHFRFVHTLLQEKDDYSNFRTFPRPFWEIVQLHGVQELHFSLTQGYWKTKKWGFPPRSAPTGAEIYAWFQHDVYNVDKNWELLTNGLSGLFCSSLNFVNGARTIQPLFSFGPDGLVDDRFNNNFVRYAALPSEIVCTENLTPWKKMLPCDTRRGLASLLDPKKIFNSNYHSLAVDWRPVCSTAECVGVKWELVLSLTLVTEPPVMNVASLGKQDWSLISTFGSGLYSHCPLAQISKVYIDVTQNQTGRHFQLLPETQVLSSTRNGLKSYFAVYDVQQSTDDGRLNIRAIYEKPIVYGVIPPPPLYATRFVAGHGNERGTVVTQITNTRASDAIKVVYLEALPWYLRVYGHTLTVISLNTKERLFPEYFHFVPGRDRVRPHHLEIVLEVPSYSTVEIQFEFEKAFLKWHEYPPDANHGFDIPAAIISAYLFIPRNYTALSQESSTFESSMNVSSAKGYALKMHSETLVVTMATPDFSMPYNVICLTCTVVALAFGPLHNYTTKRFVKRLPKESKGKKFFNSLREKMKWGKGKGEKRDEKAEVPESVDPPNTTSGECRS
ncbi:GPI transamidase component PIG-T-like [Artemia franciscana]|uniref:GPI transamidase component PIG-T-like n=1 Tax=Artemia franciscana TaxID=6661 RepID=UPI0032DA702C